MSTFGGVMTEFPDIRVDYFHRIPLLRPPLACFLSHVHSDHLAGLETLKAPFVYCSAATKEILLRLERYHHRLNFARGVLEARKQHYKHLEKLLKPIPLETPTRIELEPGNEIQVTFFDANHCTGAIMCLFEGKGRAVLYTGDIRSEPWFVNNLTRNPHMIEYTTGLKTLDCIYLDTSNIAPIPFPTKAEGLRELLTKVATYPSDTIFHLTAWTFGYEEVWMALSRALKSPIHIDDYKFGLYKSLRGDSKAQSTHFAPEGPTLSGFTCGNTPQPGCLTRETNVRLHSCEKGMMCPIVNENEKIVWIRPIITRTKSGEEVGEMGIGGGGGDLVRGAELGLDDDYMVEQLLDLFESTDEAVLGEIRKKLFEGLHSNGKAISLDDMGFNGENEISISELTQAFVRTVTKKHKEKLGDNMVPGDSQEKVLPGVITFPYSRHSSYPELCHLVEALNPKDVYPCTVDKDNWRQGISMKALFGRECSAHVFRHDMEMEHLHEAIQHEHEESSQHSEGQQTQSTTSSQSSQSMPPPSSLFHRAQIPKMSMSSLQGNARDLLRPFDEDGNEILLSKSSTSKATDAMICPNKTCTNLQIHDSPCPNCGSLIDNGISIFDRRSKDTPSREIVAVSPSSASQDRRRKMIVDALEQPSPKRPRVEDDTHSSLESRQVSGSWPSNPSDHNIETLEGRTQYLVASHHVEQFSHPDTPSSRAHSPMDEYFDKEDKVFRCKACSHEKWSTSGACTGCGAGEPAYMEVIDPGDGLYQEICPKRSHVVPNEYDSDSSDNESSRRLRDTLTNDYLDYQSSAYDSQDSDAILEEYELNSFIDNASMNGPELGDDSGNSSSSDEETDYKEKFQTVSTALSTLVADHTTLLLNHNNLLNEHERFKRDVLGSDYNSEDGDALANDDLTLVDIQVPDPVVTDIMLSQGEEQSQVSEVSEVSEAQVWDRVAWHNISLMSTGNNHTHEELEL